MWKTVICINAKNFKPSRKHLLMRFSKYKMTQLPAKLATVIEILLFLLGKFKWNFWA